MDFFDIRVKEERDGTSIVYPDFKVGRSRDLMVRAKSFYAVWDESSGMWSTDEYDIPRIVDELLYAKAEELEGQVKVNCMRSFNTKSWTNFRNFVGNLSDNSHSLDENLCFSDQEVSRGDYVSKRLPYSLSQGDISAWEELVGTLYSPEERAKIEWAIGAIVTGDSKRIQKFLVLYGPAGSGKSTILNIVQLLFAGYFITFDAKALGSSNGSFSTEVFRTNPLVAIQHDGDLSRIEDNTRLNMIVSHEDMVMNEKYKPSYSARVNAFLFMGTNQPVKISDAKSGIIRRLIDVHPSGHRIDPNRYHALMTQIEFELGGIAEHCRKTYLSMGRNFYSGYRPLEMMLQTDVFFNYVEFYYDVFEQEDGVTLKRAYSMYKEYCLETGIDKVLPQYKFREELRNYFDSFKDRATVDGVMVRSYYSGFKSSPQLEPERPYSIQLSEQPSLLDELLTDCPAQYAKSSGYPGRKWSDVVKTLSDIDTGRLHFVKVPTHHIVVDFDLVDENGEKDLDINLAAANDWPPTYTEVSQSGCGLHLHYIYGGDVGSLSNVFDTGVEIKTLLGDSSLRRRVSKCNNLPVATISSGLPKKEPKVLDAATMKSEKALRELIARNLRKEIHPGTKPSVDFIKKILDDAYESGIPYDVVNMRSAIVSFAASSTHHSEACIKTVTKMHFSSEVESVVSDTKQESPLIFFDVEVYPNLFVVCWKYQGSEQIVQMINPSQSDIEDLLAGRLVGFNNRRYDNHILYARFLGFSTKELYLLSKRIISGDRNCFFREAYGLSYADIYDFGSEKQGLKKLQLDLGIHHLELDIPWDDPVDESLWPRVIEYCCNDVSATEKVFEYRHADFVARQMLATLSGLTPNDTTMAHTARIIFGTDRDARSKFVYTDLSETYPGYIFEGNKSTYRGEEVGEGGYVYAEPGFYKDVVVLDIASMHPSSIEQLRLFGPYTDAFSELKRTRIAIKHRQIEDARGMMDGKLARYLDEGDEVLASLAHALKIVINSVYGFTSAKFDNPFRDNRNKDNIVAKRGALFMIDLKNAVQERGFRVVHIKTDSIKIPEATPEIIDFVVEYGKKYGYNFEHEATYSKFCLVNDAVYIARDGDHWSAVGAQFKHPFVFKSLFSEDPIEFDDYVEAKNVVQGTMYLDFSTDPSAEWDGDTSNLTHIGRSGRFVPVEFGGGILYRVKDGKRYAVTGTRGYRWLEHHLLGSEDDYALDRSYYDKILRDAISSIEEFCPIDIFTSQEKHVV